MFKNPKIKTYLIIFLSFCVASSKGILIYNEETLVALSFLTFVIFCFNYFGNLLKESLDERSSLIRFSLENFHRLKEEALKELLSQHKQISQLKRVFPSVGSFTQKQLSYLNASNNQSVNLHNRFGSQIQQKLVNLKSSKTALQQRLQKSIALTIPALVIVKIKQEKLSKKSGIKSGAFNSSNRGIYLQVKESLKDIKS